MKPIFFFFSIIILSSCISVKKYNEQLLKPISTEKLKKDVDFAYQKLQENHPHLYEYISKEKLDYKFDSLKTTITTPLNPSEFYQKLSPIISEVRQGHLNLFMPSKKFTKKELKKFKNQKGLFSRYKYSIDENKLFVKENPDSLANMNIGTEILEINDEKSSDILNKYRPFITSDGYNSTYHKYALARRWVDIYSIQNGILDSVKLKTKFNNEINTFYLSREKLSKTEKKKEKTITKEKKEQKNLDYNAAIKAYNRSLEFKTKDSSIAVMRIKTFSGIRAKKFYKESFTTLANAKTENLIIDLRYNLGGSLSEIENFYRYLGANKFPLINKIEVTSPYSTMKADYFNHFPILGKPFAVAGYPIYSTLSLLAVKKEGNKYFLKSNKKNQQTPKEFFFRGKIYVIINGSSFSASSIISSKLKGDKRAILVGEETGGANDGTVAGRYNTKKLPNSRLKFPIGLMYIQPNIEPTKTQKGVLPDVEIIENREDVQNKKDVILDWILEDISKNSNNKLIEN